MLQVITYCDGKYLSATVEPWRILSGKEHESGMSLHYFLCLCHKELPVVIEQTVKSLQDIRGGQVQLIQNDPVTLSHGINQNTYVPEAQKGNRLETETTL